MRSDAPRAIRTTIGATVFWAFMRHWNSRRGTATHELTETYTATNFIGFVRKVVRAYAGQILHVILDNSSTHSTPDVRRWLEYNRHVRFHFTPTTASWLNQVEGSFGILGKQSLSTTGFPSKKALREHIAAYMRSWNMIPTPFEWTKPAAAIIKSNKRMRQRMSEVVDRISMAVH